MDKRLKQLEQRVDALEKQAVLFEEHRRAWIKHNDELKTLWEERLAEESHCNIAKDSA